MDLYLAGNAGLKEREKRWIRLMNHRLISYFEWCTTENTPHPFILIHKKMKKENKKVNLFLDSGAFSAFTQKQTINIQEYITFIKKHQDVITIYANLDVINNSQATWKNQRIMERAGLSPLPVFHYGEDPKWLERYIKRGHQFIALGGLVGARNSALVEWLDPIWEKYLTDENGIPIIKVHGFGMTSLRLMMRYPWYSVDSTSWVVTGRLGGIYVPRWKNEQWVYGVDPWKISVSTRSPDKKDAGEHIETLQPSQKKLILSYIHANGYKLGKSEFKSVSQSHELADNERWAEKKPKDKQVDRLLEILIEKGISNMYQLRDELNIIYFLELENQLPKWPWAFKQKSMKGLF